MSGKTGKHAKTRTIATPCLLLLSLLWASGALRTDLLPGLFANSPPYLERQVLPLAMLALAAALIAPRARILWRSVRHSAWIGLGLFAVPAMLVYLADAQIPGLARTGLFTLVPVFAVVFEPYIGSRSATQSHRGLLAALVSVVGALLVFPVVIPHSIEAGAGLGFVILAAGCLAAANCFGVATAAILSGNVTGQIASMASIAGATGAVVLAIASACLERPVWRWNDLWRELLWSAGVEMPALLLLFWLMPRMSAPRMVTRYVLGPLLALLIGMILLQSVRGVPPLMWLGLVLMGLGAGWMLFGRRKETSPSATPLGLTGR
jgi:hypothetical protein